MDNLLKDHRWPTSRPAVGLEWETMLKRDVSVLPGRILIALGVEHLQRLNNAAASVARANDRIDITAFSRNVGIGEALAKLLDLLRAQLCQCLFPRLAIGAISWRPGRTRAYTQC